MSDVRLTGKQIQGLQRALMSAYDDNSLEQMVFFELDENLDAIVPQGSLSEMTFDLIKWATRKGRLEDLIAGAREQNSGNPDLKAYVAELGLYAESPPDPGGRIVGQLEAMVTAGVRFQDVAQWRKRMEQVERTTCMVEDSSGSGWGTGFLVKDDVIMTNQHVVEKLKDRGGTPQVRFGYIRSQTGPGADNGTVYGMVGTNWELISSPPEELDFSLLRLSHAAGQDDVAGQARGYLKPATNYQFKRDEPILVIQHPQLEPMKLGVGYLRDWNSLSRRIAYTTNTEPGSSGSPCFNFDLDLVAIHHHGDNFTNHGTPVSDILAYLKTKGKESLFG